jgi:hypothetical protein
MATQIGSFSPASYGFIIGSNAAQTVAITGSPAIALVSNSGNSIAYVAFGASVTPSTGVAILPNTTIALTVSSATQLSGIGVGAVLNIAFGS